MKTLHPLYWIAAGIIAFAIMWLDVIVQNAANLSEMSLTGKIAFAVFIIPLLYWSIGAIIGLVMGIFRKKNK